MFRYWKIYRVFLTSSLSRELEFRANFIAKIFQNIMWIAYFLVVLLVIYTRTDSIAGWSRADAIVLGGTVFLLNAIAGALTFSVNDIPGLVRQGTLDFVLTKPVDSQYWVSLRRFNFDQFGTLLSGVGLVAFGFYQSHVTPSPLQWLSYLLLLVVALVVFYALVFSLMTTGIWFVRVDNLWVLAESVSSVSRYPLDIYPLGIQRVFTFVLPLAFLATVPTRQLLGHFDGLMLGLGLVWAVGLFAASRAFWNFAMRHYSSASS